MPASTTRAFDPLVLLPGMNCSDRLWADVVARLRRDGLADDVHHGRLNDATVDRCVASLLPELPDRFALGGLSLGGIVAMALVRQAPQRVSRLLLMSTNARGPSRSQLLGWAAQRHALAEGATARDLQRDLLPVLLHPARRTPALDEQVLLMADEIGEDILARQLAMQASRADERPALSRVRVPTLVVAADGDALCPLERHTEIEALIPGSRLVVLKQTGHLAPLEAPGQVAAAFEAWLRS